MKKIIIISFLTCSLISNVFAEPFGYLICSLSVNTSNQQVFAIDVFNGATQLLTKTEELWTSYDGVSAPPFIGNPCVIQDGVGNNIDLLSFDGTKTILNTDGDGESTDPCFSFDGLKIAYIQKDVSVSNEDVLHIMNYDGSGNTIVYTTPLWNVNIERPVFSPDGSTLAFAMDDMYWNSRDIYHVSVNGGVPEEFTELPADAMHPAYSPDGKKLACVSQHGGGTYHLFIANADGSNPQQITSGGTYALFPAFSPDSKYIAICSDNEISIIDLSNNQIIKNFPLDYDTYYGLTWCLGAQKSGGTLTKAKIKEKAVALKIENMLPTTAPDFGYIQIDNTVFKLGDTNLWSDKKGKKYFYKDKINKVTAKITVKNKKSKFSAKKLQLVEGTDYRLNTNVTVVVNFGDKTLVETIQFDKKGKYKSSK